MATKVDYTAKIINSPEGLSGYSSPDTSSQKITTFDNGSIISIHNMTTNKDDVWYQEPVSQAWIPYMSAKGKTSLKTKVKPLKNSHVIKILNLCRICSRRGKRS